MPPVSIRPCQTFLSFAVGHDMAPDLMLLSSEHFMYHTLVKDAGFDPQATTQPPREWQALQSLLNPAINPEAVALYHALPAHMDGHCTTTPYDCWGSRGAERHVLRCFMVLEKDEGFAFQPVQDILDHYEVRETWRVATASEALTYDIVRHLALEHSLDLAVSMVYGAQIKSYLAKADAYRLYSPETYRNAAIGFVNLVPASIDPTIRIHGKPVVEISAFFADRLFVDQWQFGAIEEALGSIVGRYLDALYKPNHWEGHKDMLEPLLDKYGGVMALFPADPPHPWAEDVMLRIGFDSLETVLLTPRFTVHHDVPVGCGADDTPPPTSPPAMDLWVHPEHFRLSDTQHLQACGAWDSTTSLCDAWQDVLGFFRSFDHE